MRHVPVTSNHHMTNKSITGSFQAVIWLLAPFIVPFQGITLRNIIDNVMNWNQFLDRQFSFCSFRDWVRFLISDLRVHFCAPYMYDYCLWKYDMYLLLTHSVLLLHALVQLQSTSKTRRILGEKSARRQYRKTQGKCQME